MSNKKRKGWTRCGWRSLRHWGYPLCVVRFGTDGPKLKLLTPEVEFNTNETAQGRVPAETLLRLRKEAEQLWKEMDPGQYGKKRRK